MVKKIQIVLVCMLFSFIGFSQSRFFVNLNGGIDYNMNKYYSPNGYKKFVDGKTDLNVGMDVGYRFGKWFRFRVEMRYNVINYGQRPTSTVDIVQSEMTLNNFAVNPRLDFRIWSKDKFELFLSPGMRLEYVMNSDQETIRTDGQISTRNYISTDYKESLPGVIGGAILKYNLTDHLGFTLAPDYTFFFGKIYEKNSQSLQRMNTNLGIEWTF